MATAIHRTRDRRRHQREPLDERQIKNAAGGYTFQVSPEVAFTRFLTLGTAGGTYYANERDLTDQGIALVRQCVQDLDNDVYADLVIECGNTAPKRTYALYAIAEALISGDVDLRQRATWMAHEVVKTGTDVFELMSYVRGQRGWGDTVKRVFDQFLELDIDRQALWAVKYRSRFGFTWRDMLRIQRPNPQSGARDALFEWIVSGNVDGTTGIRVLDGFRRVQGCTDEDEIIEVVREYHLPWEALTDEQRTPAVWKACTPFIGDWAVVRNLATFTRNGLGEDREFVRHVEDRIYETAGRVHPVTLLEALRTYASGGAVGRSQAATYTPLQIWSSALGRALDASFTDGVTSTDQNVYIGLDVSSSMDHPVSGSAVLSCRDVGSALALAFVKNEPWSTVYGFSSQGWGRDGAGRGWGRRALTPLNFTERDSFNQAIQHTSSLPHGGTDCALPIVHAMHQNMNVDTFVVITDNETWAGDVHPMRALKDYRKGWNPKAKLAVVALTATRNTIADPADAGTMDFSGFSSDLPRALSTFMTMES